MCIAIIGCKQAEVKPSPSNEGEYQLIVTSTSQFDGSVVVTETYKGTLTVAKNADGTYTFTEKVSDNGLFYQGIVTDNDLQFVLKPSPFKVSGVEYQTQYTGSGQFKTNSVSLIRKTSFKAGSLAVSNSITSYGYR